MVILKLTVIITCGIISFQDFRERAVLWVLFPLVAILLAVLHIYHTSLEQFLLVVLTNTLLVTMVLLLLYLYTKHIARKQFLNTSFGLGDVLFFYAFALGFPTFTFVLLFVGSILFSLLTFLITKTGREMKTVPLAGLMGLFLIGITVVSFLPESPSLYLL